MQDLKALEGKSLVELREIAKAIGIGHSQFMVKAPAEGRDLQFFILNFEIMHYLCKQIPMSRRPPGF